MGLVILRDCDACGQSEERLFTDSWTGKELCISCLAPAINQLALSPASEGDNLTKIIDFEEN
jgi:hypothetical protein